jgi:hypothetical protein
LAGIEHWHFLRETPPAKETFAARNVTGRQKGVGCGDARKTVRCLGRHAQRTSALPDAVRRQVAWAKFNRL